MPGELHYQYNLAFVLARMERFDDARAIARKLQTSGDPDVISLAGKFLAQVEQEQQFAAYQKMQESNPASATTVHQELGVSAELPAPALRQRAQNVGNPATAVDGFASSASAEPPPAAAPRAYSMVGTITEANCAPAPQVRITLKAQSIVMHLHAGDFSQVAVKFAGANSAAKNPGCAALRGRNAHVSYQLVSDKDWEGELVSIEFRDSP
jgi:hypothetical protein